jgi:photosystem II stability/assembly factor-like uncharacterized protein
MERVKSMLDLSRTNGSKDLSVIAFTVASLHNDSLALAASTTGLFISRDDCQSWKQAPGAIGSFPIMAVCLSPSYDTDRLAFLGTKGGIVYSQNLTNWTLASLPRNNMEISSLGISPEFINDGILFAGTLDDGMFHSKDRGSSWQSRNFGLLDLGVLALALSPIFPMDQTAIVGTSTGIFRTQNGGLAWRETTVPNDDDPVLSLAFSPTYENDGVVFAGTERGMLLKSGDNGKTWIEIEAPCSMQPINTITFHSYPRSGDLLIIGGAKNVYTSIDRGSSWETWEAPSMILSVTTATGASGHPFILIGLEERGIWRGQLGNSNIA